MNLIILTDSDRLAETSFRLTDHRADHIRTILKAGVGDTIEVGLLNGPQGRARVESVDSTQVVLQCDAWHDIPKLGPEIDLICALPRPQTLKKVLITSAMMGVRSLHLIRANRVEKSYFQSPLIQPEQQLSYLVEGLAQGKLTRLPLVNVHERFRQFFEDDLSLMSADASVKPLRLLCDSETNNRLDQVFDPAVKEMIVAVGPEGGWVPFELELMHGFGFRSFTLGRWTLRVEHAVTAALSQIELLRMMSGK
jgi:16S rRNA (uracil1498-N3)-methyltransferase